MTKYGGAIAACGLAQGMDLPASVAPFILRGVALLGVDSVMCPKPRRTEAWQRLASDLDRDKLALISTTIPLDAVIEQPLDGHPGVVVDAKAGRGVRHRVMEAAREVGGRELLRLPFTWPPKQAANQSVQGSSELGQITLQLTP